MNQKHQKQLSLADFLRGMMNSYAQVFFSKDKILGGVVVLITFFDFGIGLCGLLAVLVSQLTCKFLFFDKELIKSGLHSYNSLMVGLAIGTFYTFNFSIVMLTVISSILTFLFSEWLAKSTGENKLPFLSLPFLIVIWIVLLGADNFSSMQLNVKQIHSINAVFPSLIESITSLIAYFPFSNVFYLYFRSLGAVVFQYNDLAGLLIAIALLYHSRISFLLSVFGFLIGYLFYHFFEGDFTELIYSYIGFNFILTAIAIGGFFVIPSRRSFALLIISIPVIALLISSLTDLFQVFNLPFYSLPYNIVVLLILSAIKLHGTKSKLDLTLYQNYLPEKNLANHNNFQNRFKDTTYHIITLPFIGKWRVSQGYDGNITHIGAWGSALDFDIVKEGTSQTYKNAGLYVKDYYCYNLPVIAPADGNVVEVIDGIPDNPIGEIDTKNNWGNTIIIKHGEYLYSKICHLKAGSFVVGIGDFVTKNQLLAKCGNSGRSPEPHIHFQLQAQPYIGSHTLEYAISYYLTEEEGKTNLNSFKVPIEGDLIQNVKLDKDLYKAFDFKPGSILVLETSEDKETLEVFSNEYNELYLKCEETNDLAYFVNNGVEFFFTTFIGSKSTLLYEFYLAAYRISFCPIDGIEVKDKLPKNQFLKFPFSWLEDFLSPFCHISKASFSFKYLAEDNPIEEKKAHFRTGCEVSLLGRSYRNVKSRLIIDNERLNEISFDIENKNKKIQCVQYNS